MTQLIDLSTEALIAVFSFCGVRDILNLRLTCRRFNEIIRESLPNSLFGSLLVTGQGTQAIKNRSQVLLSCLEKFRILNNWKKGRYLESTYLYERERFLPKVQITKDYVWFSRAHCVSAYRRRGKKIDLRPVMVLNNDSGGEICKFIKNQRYVVAGLNDGHIWVWFDDLKQIITSNEFHQTEINDIDVNEDLVISGARNGEFSLWRIKNENKSIQLCDSGRLENRIWSNSFNESRDVVALGTSACTTRVPICIFDLNRLDTPLHIYGTSLEKGSSVLDIKWLTNSTFLTCGHDTFVRKWDLRIGDLCVQVFKDPFQSALYCMDTDKIHTLITGTQSFGRIVLYDMRSPKYIQLYFLKTCKGKGRSSPVYSLNFEPQMLFAGTDRYLNVLDFSGRNLTGKDYSCLYHREICM